MSYLKTSRWFPPMIRALAALAVLTALAAPRPAVAQSEARCAAELELVAKSYAEGLFDDALDALDACLEKGPRRNEKIQAARWRAKALLAADDKDAARHAIEELLLLSPSFAPDPTTGDSPRFIRLVEEVKGRSSGPLVSTVSKTVESLREAPATVTVITAEQIRRRGYIDLEAVLHDLSGFDISRGHGGTYSNIYHRGFRSDLTTRTLFLVDGVEENDLQSRVLYFSRQFPLSNVDRIEVIYGPAATMYGANAFTGVINVITKDVDQVLEEKSFKARVDVGSGSYSTSYLDGTVAGRTAGGKVKWMLTGRKYTSDEMDLSGFEEWNFDPDDFQDVDYVKLLSLSGASADTFRAFLQKNPGLDCRGQEGCTFEDGTVENGEAGIRLTPAGVEQARGFDLAAYQQPVQGDPLGFTNPTEDWLIHGKLKVHDALELGFQTWRREEAQTPFHTDFFGPGGDNGLIWTPRQSWFYLRYSRPLSDRLKFSVFSRFKIHELGNSSQLTFFGGYANGSRSLQNLLEGRASSFDSTYYFRSSTQLRNEISVVYEPSKRFNLVAGFDQRNSSIPGDFITSKQPNPSETGAPASTLVGGNQFNPLDLGIYAQASWRVRENLKLVAGGRLDYNRVRESGGFGTEFNPRLAAIYTHRDFVFKLIYAEAFQDASNKDRFVTTPNVQLPNPGLAPEKVRNLEVSAGWQPWETFEVQLVGYRSQYSSIIQLNQIDCPPGTDPTLCSPGSRILRFEGIGSLEIEGLQLDARLGLGERWALFGNYTFTDPVSTDPRASGSDVAAGFGEFVGGPLLDANGDPVGELRVGDIASHQLNFGLDVTDLWRGIGLNLRANWVGSRRRGLDTTVRAREFPEIDDYLVTNLTLRYENLARYFDLALIVNNLFDEEYYDPGVRTADGVVFASRLPQRSRNAFLRLSLDF